MENDWAAIFCHLQKPTTFGFLLRGLRLYASIHLQSRSLFRFPKSTKKKIQTKKHAKTKISEP